MNKALLLGNLTADPELKSSEGGLSVATFTVATNESYTNKQGEKVDNAQFTRCVAFGKTADNIHKYFGKGRKILVEGKIQTRQWQDKEGNNRYTTEVVVQTFHFTGSKADSGGQSNSQSAPPSQGTTPQQHQQKAQPQAPAEDEVTIDDLPF